MPPLRLVNQTDPHAYEKHPYWKDLKYEGCEGNELKNYRENQFSVTEASIQVHLTMTWNVVAVASLLYVLYHGKFQGYGAFFRSAAVTAILGFMTATLVLMHTHFAQVIPTSAYLCNHVSEVQRTI